MVRWLGIVLLLASGAIAQAQEKTEKLLWLCLGEEPISDAGAVIGQIACARYIGGLLDMHSIAVEVQGAAPLFCAPGGGVSADQAMRIFMKWANENPAKLHLPARTSVLFSLRGAFPCAGNG